jgi:hypothetical protein
VLVVQVVTILWTKATRGAPRANERVSLPRSFVIELGTGECLVQQHRIAEWEAFSPMLVESGKSLSLPGGIEGLYVTRETDLTYLIGILGTPYFGQPKRRAIQNALKVTSGKYARIIVNARHTSSEGSQSYSETIYNVACGEEIPANRFLQGSPDHELDLKANLF